MASDRPFYKGEKSKLPENMLSLDKYPKVKGYDFSQEFDFDALLQSFATTGFQATHLSTAIYVVNAMIREDVPIYLSATSNMISSGIREIITYLIKEKKIHSFVTTAGGVEEDIIKSIKPFVIGDFSISGKYLLDNGIARTGNLLVPRDRYLEFELFMNKVFEKVHTDYNDTITGCDLIKLMGSMIDKEDSYLYWAAKNDIDVYCPGLIDGSLGDLMYFAKQRYPNLIVDVSGDIKKMVDKVLQLEKTGSISLGGGLAKHFAYNVNSFKDGFDYAVSINTAQEFDGSDSGARQEESVSWAKIKPDAPKVKVHCDASIAFPLLVAATFAKN